MMLFTVRGFCVYGCLCCVSLGFVYFSFFVPTFCSWRTITPFFFFLSFSCSPSSNFSSLDMHFPFLVFCLFHFRFPLNASFILPHHLNMHRHSQSSVILPDTQTMPHLACLVILATFSFSATGSACHSDPIAVCQLESGYKALILRLRLLYHLHRLLSLCLFFLSFSS